jgi:pyruvate/2-oxoglutarate dehydrogenase complex dihydrolipoamide acyltransferase (E2) component
MTYALVVPEMKDISEVRMLEWHVEPGESIESGVLLAELETHKVIIEIRATQKGVLRSVLCNEGEWRKLGEPLAIFTDETDSPVPAEPGGLPAWDAHFGIG